MRTEQINEYKKILEIINQENITYCLLRNHEFLIDETYKIEGLDLALARKDLEKWERLLLAHGFTRRKPQFSLAHRAYFKLVHTQLVSFDVQVGGVYWNDMKYLDESIIQNRQKKNFFYVLSPDDTFVMLLTHSILGKRYFKAKYQKILSSLIIDENYVIQKLSAIFTKKIAQNLLNNVKNNKFSKIPVFPLVLFFIFKNRSRVAAFTSLSFRWLAWKKPLTPAPLISILGPDGAGKSTLVQALYHHLIQRGKMVSIVYTGRGKSHLLPITRLGKAYKRIEKKQDAGLRKRTSLPRKFLYTLSAPLFTLDLLLRYSFHIFPKRRLHRIVITDRYSFDLMLMKHVPFSFRRFLVSFFPKPTITIFLYNDVDELLKRRPLENKENIEHQLQIYHTFTYSLKLKTSSLEDVHRTVIEYVDTYLLKNWW